MITSLQAQSFGGAWGCCSGPKHEDDPIVGILIAVVVLVCAALIAWGWWTGSRRSR